MQMKLVESFGPYQRLVLGVARMVRRRGIPAKDITEQHVLEVCYTLPWAMKLMTECGFDEERWTKDQRDGLLNSVKKNVAFMEGLMYYDGEQVHYMTGKAPAEQTRG